MAYLSIFGALRLRDLTMNDHTRIGEQQEMDSPELIEEAKPETGLELHVGSNIFRNINGVVKLQGKEHMFWEVVPDLQTLLLTMDLYDENGVRVGHIRRNTIKNGGAGRFAIAVNSQRESGSDQYPSITVSDHVTGSIVLEAFLVQGRKIRIATGRFYSHKGDLVQVSQHYCRIGTGKTLFGDVTEGRGGTAAID